MKATKNAQKQLRDLGGSFVTFVFPLLSSW